MASLLLKKISLPVARVEETCLCTYHKLHSHLFAIKAFLLFFLFVISETFGFKNNSSDLKVLAVALPMYRVDIVMQR